jgi:hypothetical protein
MADIKVYSQETIQDAAFPVEQTTTTESESTTGASAKVYTPVEIQEQSMPQPRIAVELLSTQLNTRTAKILAEFGFTPSGAIQVGIFQNGVSGDIRISPNGIVARDISGNTTFALDGDTGDATFAGTVQAGTLISGAVAVGDGSILIDGSTKRMVFYDDNNIPVIIIGNA